MTGLLIGAGIAVVWIFVQLVVANGQRNLARGRGCPTCGAQTRTGRAARQAGVVTSFATGSYQGARLARDVHAVQTGRVGTRITNLIIGRTLVSRMWRR